MDNLYFCKLCKESKDSIFFKLSPKTGRPSKRCVTCNNSIKKEYNAINLKQHNDFKKEWAKQNREKVVASRKKWKQNNIGAVKASKASRKVQVERATPKWLNQFQKDGIAAKYEWAEYRSFGGIKYHVDHIIPLQGKDICGLHVPWNLEVIKGSENCSKNNKIPRWATTFYPKPDFSNLPSVKAGKKLYE